MTEADHNSVAVRGDALGEPNGAQSAGVKLSEQQNVFYRALCEKSPSLGVMYLGALAVLTHKVDPDRLAQAAHSVRELMEKIPQYVEVPIPTHDVKLKPMVDQLLKGWKATTGKSQCWDGAEWAGSIDGHLSRFLKKLGAFFNSYAGLFPARRTEVVGLLRRLRGPGGYLPEGLERSNYEDWRRMKEAFDKAAHHGPVTEKELVQLLGQLEMFLLDYLHPRTFADFGAIDEIIREGENGA
jgi:hypothetical protein